MKSPLGMSGGLFRALIYSRLAAGYNDPMTNPVFIERDDALIVDTLLEDLAVAHGEITTAKISCKVLKQLLSVAEEKGKKVEHRIRGDHDNIYIEGRLFAGAEVGLKGFCYLVIGL